MKWRNLGFLVRPDKNIWWMQTHAMVPTIEMLGDNLCKVYFSGRDISNRSHIGWVLINLESPITILEKSLEPILLPGRLGCFDDNGVTPSCVVNNGNEKLLYYIGWNPGSTTRMNIFGGLAISKNGGETFERYSEAPIIERSRANPFINTAPFVIKDSESRWLMYYVSGVEWVNKDFPRYNIQLGLSSDGKNWIRDGRVCIDFEVGETALARPYVVREEGIYKMWFSAKKGAYSSQYAESENGIDWVRKNSRFLMPERGKYDSDMREYVVRAKNDKKEVIFYNGNNYGEEGILVSERLI